MSDTDVVKMGVDPASGGRKQVKSAQMSQLPWDALLEVAKVAEFGSRKYARHNFRKGYPWSWNFDAMTRHLGAWVEREDLDPESGLTHLAHAAWHCLALIHFQMKNVGTDDRVEVKHAAPTGSSETPQSATPPTGK